VLLLPGVTHMAWQPEVIEQVLGAHVRFFRRWLAPGAQPGRGPARQVSKGADR
jgi:hypothetical protein